MSEGYAVPPPPGPPPARVRPATVTVAGLLILLVALAAVGYLVASIAAYPSFVDAFEQATAGTEAEDVAGFAAAGTLITGVVYLLIAAALAILTIFNNQGRNPARITTWVVGGLGLCCGGASLISIALGDFTANMGGGEGETLDSDAVEQALVEHVPGWFDPVILTSTVVGVLALLGALILLALPPSNEFFRKPAPPAGPSPGYPGYPPVG